MRLSHHVSYAAWRRFRPGRRVAAWLLAAALAGCQAAGSVAPTPAPTPQASSAPSGQEQVIRITAKRFQYTPGVIRVKRAIPVVFVVTAEDHDHWFLLRAFKVQADVDQGKTVRVRFIPDRVGTFEFHCDDYCGDFHEDMTGQLV